MLEKKLLGFVDEDAEISAKENLPEHFLEFDFANFPKFNSTLGLNKLYQKIAAPVSATRGRIARDSLLKRPDPAPLPIDLESSRECTPDADDINISSSDSFDSADVVEEDENELALGIDVDEVSVVEKEARCDAKAVWKNISRALYHIRLPDNCFIILIGVLIGGIVYAFQGQAAFREELLNFNAEIVLLILFPPLMLSFSLEVRTTVLLKYAPFILLHSVLGTIIVAFSTGAILFYLVGSSLDFVHCLLLGIALSSVDPEAVLSVFRSRRLNQRLTTQIELETFFKDVVAVVLFSIVHGIGTSSSRGWSGLSGLQDGIFGVVVGRFAWVFLFSLGCGVIVGFVATIASRFARGPLAYLQPSIVLCYGYLAWFLSELFLADGTLGILFAALVMSRYIRRNMKKKSRNTLSYILRLALLIFSSMIFCYCGISMVTMEKNVDWTLIVCANVVVFVLRFVVVLLFGVPYNAILKYCVKSAPEDAALPVVEMIARGTAGMRGAVTFALAWIVSADVFQYRGYILTTAVSIVVFTYFVQAPLSTLVLHLLRIRKAPLDPQDMINSWKQILHTLDKITTCVPEVAPRPAGRARRFTRGQRKLRRALGLYIRKGFGKLKARVKAFRRTMHDEVGMKLDYEFEEAGLGSRRSSISSIQSDALTVDDLGFSQFGEGLKSGSSPFLSAKPTHHEDHCRIHDLEQSGIRVLDRFHAYLSQYPDAIVDLNLKTGDLDPKSFLKMIEVIRPKLIRFRHYVSHYLHMLIEEHLDHRFWTSRRSDDLGTVKGGVSSLLFVTDHIIQRMLSQSMTSREKRFVEIYVEYRKFRTMKMSLPEGATKSLASITSKEDLARAMDVILEKVRRVEAMAVAEQDAIQMTMASGMRRAGDLARFVSMLNEERSQLNRFVLETERFRRALAEVERREGELPTVGDD